MRLFIVVIISLISIFQSNAQSFELKNNIEIIVKNNGEQCLVHTVEPKQTMYNISRLYNTPLQDIFAYNNLNSSDIIHQGNKIYIPLNHKIYSKNIKPSNPEYHLKPIVYITRPKDSFYAITHRYFNIEEDALIKNNNLSTKNLMIGQGLTIGWIAFKDNYSEWTSKEKKSSDTTISSEKRTEKATKNVVMEVEENIVFENMEEIETINTLPINDPNRVVSISKQNIHIDKQVELTNKINKDDDVLVPGKEYIEEIGIAMWNKQGSDKVNSFVLHPYAKINSVIELFNPLTNRTTYAKVIAHIPSNTYASDISILISPKVAERLGALDDRFKIKMVYYK